MPHPCLHLLHAGGQQCNTCPLRALRRLDFGRWVDYRAKRAGHCAAQCPTDLTGSHGLTESVGIGQPLAHQLLRQPFGRRPLSLVLASIPEGRQLVAMVIGIVCCMFVPNRCSWESDRLGRVSV